MVLDIWVSEEGGKELDVRDPQWGTHGVVCPVPVAGQR